MTGTSTGSTFFDHLSLRTVVRNRTVRRIWFNFFVILTFKINVVPYGTGTVLSDQWLELPLLMYGTTGTVQ